MHQCRCKKICGSDVGSEAIRHFQDLHYPRFQRHGDVLRGCPAWRILHEASFARRFFSGRFLQSERSQLFFPGHCQCGFFRGRNVVVVVVVGRRGRKLKLRGLAHQRLSLAQHQVAQRHGDTALLLLSRGRHFLVLRLDQLLPSRGQLLAKRHHHCRDLQRQCQATRPARFTFRRLLFHLLFLEVSHGEQILRFRGRETVTGQQGFKARVLLHRLRDVERAVLVAATRVCQFKAHALFDVRL